jgi:hypothetical protein
VTEFPSDEPAVHPTGFPVESEPDARPDPETEPGGGEPDFDSEPDRTATHDSTHHNPNNPIPTDDPPNADPTPPQDADDDASGDATEGAADEAHAADDEVDGAHVGATGADVGHDARAESAEMVDAAVEMARVDGYATVGDDGAGGPPHRVAGVAADEADELSESVVGGADGSGVVDEAVTGVTGVAGDAGGVGGAVADDTGGAGGAEEWSESHTHMTDGGAEDDSAESADVGGRVSGDEEGERGHPLVEETMERLEDLRGRPVSEHGEVYADLHERLQSALAEAERPDAHERV